MWSNYNYIYICESNSVRLLHAALKRKDQMSITVHGGYMHIKHLDLEGWIMVGGGGLQGYSRTGPQANQLCIGNQNFPTLGIRFG